MWRGLVGGIAAITATVAGTAAGADAWNTYRNEDAGVSVEMPGTPQVETTRTPSPTGPIPTLIVKDPLGQTGLLLISVADYRQALKVPAAEVALEKAVKGGVVNSRSTLDSETIISVAGWPAREITFHSAQFVARSRIVFADERLFIILGVGTKSGGVPSEYERFEQSLTIIP